MRLHDWHLTGYSVRDGGTSVTMHLAWDYEGSPRMVNDIVFSDVAAYRFTHGDGAILAEIAEGSIADYLRKEADFICATERQLGLRYWNTDLASYGEFLTSEAFRYWRIYSSMGFEGFVVAKAVHDTLADQQAGE